MNNKIGNYFWGDYFWLIFVSIIYFLFLLICIVSLNHDFDVRLKALNRHVLNIQDKLSLSIYNTNSVYNHLSDELANLSLKTDKQYEQTISLQKEILLQLSELNAKHINIDLQFINTQSELMKINENIQQSQETINAFSNKIQKVDMEVTNTQQQLDYTYNNLVEEIRKNKVSCYAWTPGTSCKRNKNLSRR